MDRIIRIGMQEWHLARLLDRHAIEPDSPIARAIRSAMQEHDDWQHVSWVDKASYNEAMDVLVERVLRKHAPYPFCRHPRQCFDAGYCKRDPACND